MALSDDLKAYYSLDEASGNAIDAHSTHDGVETSGTIGSATGKVGNCRDFEAGDSEWFLAADHADLSAGNDFTIAAWVNLESLALSSIVYKGGSNDLEYDLGFDTQRFRFRISSGAGFTNLTSVNATSYGMVSTATWAFVVVRHSASLNQIDISVDGGAVDSASYSAGSYDSAGSFFIGSNPFTEHFDGLIDEVGFWKRYLSDAEIDELYNAGAGRDYAYITGGAAPTGNRRRRVLICGAAA